MLENENPLMGLSFSVSIKSKSYLVFRGMYMYLDLSEDLSLLYV